MTIIPRIRYTKVSFYMPTYRITRDESGEKVFRVSEINRAVRMVLEEGWANIWIEGELSDVIIASSGHCYFALNDEERPAQLRGVMFRSDLVRAKAEIVDGARVRMRGTLSLFEPRGSYQLIARAALPAGIGDLQQQFEKVRKKLEAEGLLAEERKRPLPLLPRVIGVVTSGSGAALHDIIRVTSERCPVRIVLSPCLVQGVEAPQSIIAALEAIQKLPELEVVIIGRGGGSADDLNAFNNEDVARAIAMCRVPIVSAVGHEVDITIADLVADVRAATPSNAAEITVPERDALIADLETQRRALERSMEVVMMSHRLVLDRLSRKLRDPREALAAYNARLQSLGNRMAQTIQRRLVSERARLQELSLRLSRRDPRLVTAQQRAALAGLDSRLQALSRHIYASQRARLAELSSRLQALSPLDVLSRGYAIALHEKTGKALLRASEAETGDRVTIRLYQGELKTKVE
jgi:exodeoxyribonuclease VII large subunit